MPCKTFWQQQHLTERVPNWLYSKPKGPALRTTLPAISLWRRWPDFGLLRTFLLSDPIAGRKVRAIAFLLWKVAGKPDGTALANWLQAERLVKSATAAVAQ